ncbi:MAG TPA: phosphatase [Gammaproteobacteria bacterium]|nr:phosphatase [Gammaproteobacteria bacterium]
MSIDLHCHSVASDGVLTPAAVVARAAERGVRFLALSDHDSIGGLAEAGAAAALHGITLIPGVEISVLHAGRTLHVLGLNVNPDAPALAAALAEQARLRHARGEAMAERFRRAGMAAIAEHAWALAGVGSVGRMHFARALVELGHVRNEEAAFRRWLKPGRPAHVAGGWIELEPAVAAIRAASGTAVLAHPLRYGLSHTKFMRLADTFRAIGGEGLELGPARLARAEIDAIVGACGRYGLGLSVGSDFHAPGPLAELGNVVTLPERLPAVWEAWGLPRQIAPATAEDGVADTPATGFTGAIGPPLGL